MVLPRSTAFRLSASSIFTRSAARTARPAQFLASWQRTAQHSLRRGYASSSGGAAKAGSDMPWAIAAIAITIPSVWYLLQPSSDQHHGGHGHDDHGAKAQHNEEPEVKEATEEKEEPSAEQKSDEDDKEKSDEKPDESKDESDDKGEEKSEDEGKEEKDEGDKAEDKDAGNPKEPPKEDKQESKSSSKESKKK